MSISLQVSQERSKPLLDDMHARLLRDREPLSRSSEVLRPMNYMLRRWAGFARFLDDGRICPSNNAGERTLRGIALGSRHWTLDTTVRLPTCSARVRTDVLSTGHC